LRFSFSQRRRRRQKKRLRNEMDEGAARGKRDKV
jgi:hypothetical protein